MYIVIRIHSHSNLTSEVSHTAYKKTGFALDALERDTDSSKLCQKPHHFMVN